MITRIRRQYTKRSHKPLFYLGKYMNRGLEVGYSFEEQEFAGNNNVIISGTSGGGKSVLAITLCDQIGRGLYFDPKGSAQSTVNEFGLKDWTFYDTQAKKIRLNISELKKRSLRVLLVSNTQKEEFMMRVFDEFFVLSKTQQSFPKLRRMLAAAGFYQLANHLELIFAKRGGISLKELMSQKVCWNVHGLSPFHKAFGVLIQMVYDFSAENRSEKKYFLSVDDAQTHCTSKTALGKAFSISFSEGRFFNVTNLLVGTHLSYIAYGVKVNTDLIFYFPSKKEAPRLKKLGVDFKSPEMVNLRKAHSVGCCFVESETMPFFVGGRKTNFDEPVPLYFDIYGYLERVEGLHEREREYGVDWGY